MKTRSTRVGKIFSAMPAWPRSGSYKLSPSSSCNPKELVALPWGSRSMSRMRKPSSARAQPRFTAVVVLPTPPFWFATAMIFMGDIVSNFVLRARKLRGNNLGAKLERPAAIRFLPEQVLRIRQHLGHFQLARFRKPSVEDLHKKVALEIDENRFRVFIAPFDAAPAESLFTRANIDVTRPSFRGAQALDCGDEISRNTSVISR